MLEDYIINEQIRYEDHYLKVAQTEIEIGGVAGAALLSALIVDTEEGTRRGIAIDSDAERMAWMKQYEREVRRDEWGLLGAEVELLNNAYIDLATSEVEWADICPNVLLSDLALQLVTTYMRYLTVEAFGNHIWEYQPWVEPFARWSLMEQAGAAFLPADGYSVDGTEVFDAKRYGSYWTSTPYSDDQAYHVPFDLGYIYYDNMHSPCTVYRSVRTVVPWQPQGIDNANLQSEIINHKFIKNGMLFIHRDGKTYTVTGRTTND